MSVTILVAYASRYGSTKEAAEKVAEHLCGLGVDAVALPARDVRSLETYSAVVLAAPFYIGSILKDARRFLDQHRAALEKVPLALMVFGPTAKGDMAEDRKQLDALRAKTPWLKPVTAEMFVGKYDPAVLRGLDKFIARLSASPLRDKPMQDERDWDAIRAWTSTLPAAFRLQR